MYWINSVVFGQKDIPARVEDIEEDAQDWVVMSLWDGVRDKGRSSPLQIPYAKRLCKTLAHHHSGQSRAAITAPYIGWDDTYGA